jgi:phosphoglycolate phosphatase
MIRAIAFDLDGTLIDTAPDLTFAVNAMLRQIGRAEVTAATVLTFIGGGLTEFVERALTATSPTDGPIPPALRAGAEVAFRVIYRQHLFERSRLYAGVSDALCWLGDNNVPVACITNKESQFALPLLHAAQLRQHFDQCFCADLASDRKPSPNLLVTACTQLRIAPHELLYVGDSRGDIIAAHNAGCRSAAVNYGYQDLASFGEPKPDFVVDNLLALTEKLFAADARTGAALNAAS